MQKIGPKQASEEILEAKKCKKLVMKRLYVIIGFKSDQKRLIKPRSTISMQNCMQNPKITSILVNSRPFPTLSGN